MMQRQTTNATFSLTVRDIGKLDDIRKHEGRVSRSETVRMLINLEHRRLGLDDKPS